MKYSIEEIQKIVQSKKITKYNDVTITGIAIDSRKVKPGDLFIPFIGDNTDGHNYIQKAFDNGAVASLSLRENLEIENNIIYIADSYNSIQLLAKDYLKKLSAKVVAITGSNGKTTTKDIISEFLSIKYKIHKTIGNFNNELGVPITILSAPENTEILILEMGADGFGQLNFLSKLVEPDFAIITNIGESHLEFFKDRAGIANGKFEIVNYLKNDGIFIYNGDEPLLSKLVFKKSDLTSLSCGFSNNNDMYIKNYKFNNYNTSFSINDINKKFETKLRGKHNLLNILYSYAVAKELGIDDNKIIEKLNDLEKITKMRLENINFKNNLIINDAYNASPTSMKAAIDVLENINNYDKKTLVLGNMYELGVNEIQFHKDIAEYINNNSKTINRIITIGCLAKFIHENILLANIEKLHFENNKNVEEYFENKRLNNEVLLFKASRSMKLEEIINNLIERDDNE